MLSRMRSSRGGSRRGASRPQRPVEWGGFGDAALLGVGSNRALWALAPSVVRDFYTDPTIMAILAHAVARNTAIAPAAPALSAIAFGIIVATGDPDTTTTPSLYPVPYTDPEADWLWRQVILLPPNAPSATLTSVYPPDSMWKSRARRKLSNERGLLFVAETSSLAFDYCIDVRYLLKA